MARGTAFAQSPGILLVFAFLPGIGGLITFVVFIWQLMGAIISVRQTLDYTSWLRAFVVVVLAAGPFAVIYIFGIAVFVVSSDAGVGG